MFGLLKRKARARIEPVAEGQRLLSVKQAALYLGRSPYGVRSLLWKGKLPYVQHGENTSKIWLDRKDLDRLIDADKWSRVH